MSKLVDRTCVASGVVAHAARLPTKVWTALLRAASTTLVHAQDTMHNIQADPREQVNIIGTSHWVIGKDLQVIGQPVALFMRAVFSKHRNPPHTHNPIHTRTTP
jgi:hypothetical protein